MRERTISIEKFDPDNLDSEKFWIDVNREFSLWMKVRMLGWAFFKKRKYVAMIIIYMDIHDIFQAYVTIKYKRFKIDISN